LFLGRAMGCDERGRVMLERLKDWFGRLLSPQRLAPAPVPIPTGRRPRRR